MGNVAQKSEPFWRIFRRAYYGVVVMFISEEKSCMTAGIFIFPCYSEQRFELKNSEFRCEMKF